MRNLKRLATSLVALALLLAFSSCEKQPAGDAEQEVSFNINQLMDDAKKSVTPDNNSGFPDCSTEDPAYVEVTISGTMYTLDVLTGLNDGTETQVLKFPVGTYSLDVFNVFDADNNMIWSAPIAGSYYAELWGLNGVGVHVTTGAPVTFTIEAFTKKKIDVDVLCWEEYYYEEFGFNWFDFQEVTIKTMCFFGDVCTGMDDRPLDEVAMFSVGIFDGQKQIGSLVIDNDVTSQSPAGPLCYEYPDFGDQTDETYDVVITVTNGPNGDVVINGTLDASTGVLTTTNGDSSMLDINDNPDLDGIFDFVIFWGDDCNYEHNVGVNALLDMSPV